MIIYIQPLCNNSILVVSQVNVFRGTQNPSNYETLGREGGPFVTSAFGWPEDGGLALDVPPLGFLFSTP